MKKLVCRIAAPALLLAMAVSARAEDAVKAMPQPFLRSSIASIDKIKRAATDLGIPLPDPVAAIEGKFNFFNAGWLDDSKPLGVVLVAAEGISPQRAALLAFPAHAGKAAVEDLTKLGGTPIAGEAGMVQFGEKAAFRRTADYLFIYGGEHSVLKNVDNAPFAEDYKKKETLAREEIDVAAVRTAAPKLLRNFIDNCFANAESGSPIVTNDDPRARDQKMRTELAMAVVEKIDKVSVSLEMDDQNVRLAALMSPTPMKGSREFSKPIFAPGAMATAHLAYPSADATKWALDLLKMRFELVQRDVDPALFTKQKPAFAELADAIVGDAQSLAVESVDGQMVLTVVNQYEGNINLPELFKKDMPVLDEPKLPGKPLTVVEDARGADGYTGVRIKESDSPAVLTVMQKGKIAVITLSEKEVAGGPRFTLSPTEKISDVLALRIDAGAVVKVAMEKGVLGLGMLPEDKRKVFIEKLTGKEIKLRVVNRANGAMVVDLDIPLDIAKAAALFAESVTR